MNSVCTFSEMTDVFVSSPCIHPFFFFFTVVKHIPMLYYLTLIGNFIFDTDCDAPLSAL